MSMRLTIVGALLVGAVGAAFTAQKTSASAPGSTPVVVELFTSQGCSSCPPADALLARLSADPAVIAITRPVTYWDNLGWKDTLAREGNTDLQRAYAARGGRGAGVYTPQAMVQGGSAAVGSSETELRQLITLAQSHPGPSITLTPTAGGGQSMTINGATSRAASVTVIALRSSATVRIGNGENGGRNIRYVNVVVGQRRIGSWSGGRSQFDIPVSALRQSGADRAAIVVQQVNAGPILASRLL